MPQQSIAAVQSNFTKGLVTEFSALNFPENAATDTDNCDYTIIGNVTRRLGIANELNGVSNGIPRTGFALSDYKWDNAGGDGNTQFVVRQVGPVLFFYKSSSATDLAPLSNQQIASSVDLNNFVALSGSVDNTKECQYSDGNGYLFVYHPSCNPLYVTYDPVGGTVTGTLISIRVRDFIGLTDGLTTDSRPLTLSVQHQYNLINQGWIKGALWDTNSASSITVGLGAQAFSVGAGIVGITAGQLVRILYETGGTIVAPFDTPVMSGTVTGYAAGVLTINVIQVSGYTGQTGTGWRLQPLNQAYIDGWFAAVGNYPSNADVWWYFKNASGAYDPATTNANVTISTGNAPRGHFALDLFNQQRSASSGISGINGVSTTVRPRTGTWFQGRVWYTGIDASTAPLVDTKAYSWTESIYFSQTVVDTSQFGNCFQQNDPTSETLFDLLPTDGGVITIQGCGSIYKLFSIQNGLLVFAANGIWFITGSQGIGFTANDYTITRISSVRCFSSTSFVNVNGLPYFWNEEGIYTVQPAKNGGLEVEPLTIGTILSYYEQIPSACKQYARGSYDPINYKIQWVYRDTVPSSVTERYSFNKILNLNTYNKAFFPYTVDISRSSINGILYVSYPDVTGSNPDPIFKYPSSLTLTGGLIYAEEYDESYTDWTVNGTGSINYNSYFITGYQVRGQAQKTFFPGYIWVFSTAGPDFDSSYKINSIWDYATSGNTGRWSSERVAYVPFLDYNLYFHRHKVRGHGLALQFKIQSVDGKGFNIIGWSTNDNVNTGI